MYKAIVFDIGRTLIGYNKPLNWSSLYRSALEHISNECNYHLTEYQYQAAIEVLTKYNTRVNPREYEVSSSEIFTEITSAIVAPLNDLEKVKHLYTSNDVGYRKPNIAGIKLLADKMNVTISEIIFVGDEEKDMICSNNAGAYSVLINRDEQRKAFGQQKEIKALDELLRIV